MSDWIQLVGPQQVVEFMGIRLVGANTDNTKKLLFTLIFIGAVLLLGALLRRLSDAVLGGRSEQAVDFNPNLTPHFNPILTPPIAV